MIVKLLQTIFFCRELLTTLPAIEERQQHLIQLRLLEFLVNSAADDLEILQDMRPELEAHARLWDAWQQELAKPNALAA